MIEETGAEVLLTECPSCLHNFRNAKLRTQKIEIYNITEFIAQLYQEAATQEVRSSEFGVLRLKPEPRTPKSKFKHK